MFPFKINLQWNDNQGDEKRKMSWFVVILALKLLFLYTCKKKMLPCNFNYIILPVGIWQIYVIYVTAK